VCTYSGFFPGPGRKRRFALREGRAAGHLQPGAHAGRPGLQVVGHGSAEAQIAGGQENPPVVQPQTLEERLRLARELLQRFPAPLRALVAYQLHLVELVHAQQTPCVLARRARFAPEAGRVRRVAHGQVRGFEDLVAVQVRDRYLRRGDEPQVIPLRLVRLVGELGELPGAGEGLPRHQVGNAQLFVAVLARVHVEEEVDERPLEAGSGAPEHRKARAADEGAPGKIEHPERLTQLPVSPRLERERARLTPHRHHPIGLLASLRDLVQRNVRHCKEDLLHPRLVGPHHLVQLGDALAQRPHGGDEVGGALAGALELTDLPGRLVALRLELVHLADGRTARLVQSLHLRDHRGILRVSPAREATPDLVGLVAKASDVEHGLDACPGVADPAPTASHPARGSPPSRYRRGCETCRSAEGGVNPEKARGCLT
jgi:hypothetical protein